MDKIAPIYAGRPEDFHWAGFGSGSGTNLRECGKVITPTLVFSDKPGAKLFTHQELGLERGIVHASLSAKGYKGKREEYDSRVLEILHEHEHKTGYGIDLIVLGGYMRIVSEILLKAFPDKIINVHPADLGILVEGDREYIGEDAVYDAVRAGLPKTKSSVIMVDRGTDHGEILTQGQYIYVDSNFFRTHGRSERSYREYVDGTDGRKGHQERQKEHSDWPALTTALKRISEGRLALGTEKRFFNEWRAVYLDGKALPYTGLQVNGSEVRK
jgi:phosphoribosylglycinamide formyltransferase 1